MWLQSWNPPQVSEYWHGCTIERGLFHCATCESFLSLVYHLVVVWHGIISRAPQFLLASYLTSVHTDNCEFVSDNVRRTCELFVCGFTHFLFWSQQPFRESKTFYRLAPLGLALKTNVAFAGKLTFWKTYQTKTQWREFSRLPSHCK